MNYSKLETTLKNGIVVRTIMTPSLKSINYQYYTVVHHVGGYVYDSEIFEQWEPKIEEIHHRLVEKTIDRFRLELD